jgi:hypothetical protein
LILLAVAAISCHPWDKHVDSISSGGLEQYCVHVSEDLASYPDVTYLNVSDWIQEALVTHQPFEDTWESVPGVDFYDIGDCSDLTPQETSETRIFFQVLEGPQQCPGNPGCAIEQPIQCGSHTNHTGYCAFTVFLNSPALAAGELPSQFSAAEKNLVRFSLINHEVGHVFGLDDPDEDCPDPGSCPVNEEGTGCKILVEDAFPPGIFPLLSGFPVPIFSVMNTTGYCCPDNSAHSGESYSEYCRDHWPYGDPPFPSFLDRQMVELIGDENPWVHKR